MKRYTIGLCLEGEWTFYEVWAYNDEAAKRTAKIHMIGVALGR